MKDSKINLLGAGICAATILAKTGYISQREKQELLYGIRVGDRDTFKKLQKQLISFADILGRICD